MLPMLAAEVNLVKVDSEIRNRMCFEAGTIQSNRSTAVDSWRVERDTGPPDAEIYRTPYICTLGITFQLC